MVRLMKFQRMGIVHVYEGTFQYRYFCAWPFSAGKPYDSKQQQMALTPSIVMLYHTSASLLEHLPFQRPREVHRRRIR